jgi:energy-coupling factor transporter ATP-binding protein EcfA2
MNKKKHKGKLLGVSGKLGSGKDTFAELIAKQLPNIVERHALADNLRLITEIITGVKMTLTHKKGEPFCNEVYNYTQDQKNIFLPQYNRTIGECLQQIGTDLFRDSFDSDIWVKSFFNEELYQKLEFGRIIVIPDVRFKNEAVYILDQGGYLIRLEGDPLDVRKNTTRNLNHPSETNLDDYTNFSSIIYNDKGIKELNEKVCNFIGNIW